MINVQFRQASFSVQIRHITFIYSLDMLPLMFKLDSQI